MTHDQLMEEFKKVKRDPGNPVVALDQQIMLIVRNYIENEELGKVLRILINWHGRDYVREALDHA